MVRAEILCNMIASYTRIGVGKFGSWASVATKNRRRREAGGLVKNEAGQRV
jgi:hypothetical protein